MQVDSRSGVYIFSRSRGDNRAAKLLLLRMRARREPFGLLCVVLAICRARPLWPSAPRMGNWLPSNGGRPPNPAYLRPARGSECTRRAYFRAKQATASISREKSWKVVAKKYSCFSFATLAAWREIYLAEVALLKRPKAALNLGVLVTPCKPRLPHRRTTLCALLIRPKASQRSLPLTRISSLRLNKFCGSA